MLVAYENQQAVFAKDAQPNHDYRCPACDSPVRLRRGRVMIAHFAHLPGAECAVSEGETSEHLLGKQQIFDWLRAHGYDPQMEVYLGEIHQRPDLLFSDHGVLTAVEFQCSPLSLTRLRERNDGYRRMGIRFVWALGKPYRHSLSRAKTAQFTQMDHCGRPALIYWNTQSKQFEYHTEYYRCSFASAATKYQSVSLTRPTPDPSVLQLLSRALSEIQQPLAHCPLVCHDNFPTWPTMRVELIYWRIAVVIVLTRRSLFSSWTAAEWSRMLIQIGQGWWLEFTCLQSTPRKQVIADFTQQLIAAGIIMKYQRSYILITHPHWFENLDDKYRAIRTVSKKSA
ncbi:MAG: competence protein CoiA family protein [Limosilactobacillus sp.]|uniref:competence protein CoiA n=1 Tax=Limosilactobacillus sp. TaxID=2773925 RepID=UPI0026FE84EA|nr:competence protein CoiA family protein [Limosilactobacillus sp.]